MRLTVPLQCNTIHIDNLKFLLHFQNDFAKMNDGIRLINMANKTFYKQAKQKQLQKAIFCLERKKY